MIAPFAGQRMIEVAAWQGLIRSQHVHDFHQGLVQRSPAALSRFLAPVIPFEAVGIFNNPRSDSREDSVVTTSPRRAAFIASTVSAFGTSGSRGSAFSAATRSNPA
jgi:hypothetical protein